MKILVIAFVSALACAAELPMPNAGTTQLTLHDAEQIALAHNPQISIAHLLTLAEKQQVRVVRASQLPQADLDLTAVDAQNGSRITAGGINNPALYERAAAGATLRQLITDFGRSRNLLHSERDHAASDMLAEQATRDDIQIAVDQVFYQALTQQRLYEVAEQTLKARQTLAEQIRVETANKLRSTLDLSMAEVQVSQARLLLLDAQSAAQEAMAHLHELLGTATDVQYQLVDEDPQNAPPIHDSVDTYLAMARQKRPDLMAMQAEVRAAQSYAAAEHDLWRPSVSALAVGGESPTHAAQITSPWYGAAGINVHIPLFNGFAYAARAKQADAVTLQVTEKERALNDQIVRDVRIAVLQAQLAYQRIEVSRQMQQQANQALELSAARYQVGLSGIADLTEAQAAQVSAAMNATNARYAYQTALAVLRYQTGQ